MQARLLRFSSVVQVSSQPLGTSMLTSVHARETQVAMSSARGCRAGG
jgi:hypothetical protein